MKWRRCESLTRRRERCPLDADYEASDGRLFCHVHADRSLHRLLSRAQKRALAEQPEPDVKGAQETMW